MSTDLDVPAAGRIPEAAQCARVVPLDDAIDGLFELRHRKRAPSGRTRQPTGLWMKSGLWISCFSMSETVADTKGSLFGVLTMKDAT